MKTKKARMALRSTRGLTTGDWTWTPITEGLPEDEAKVLLRWGLDGAIAYGWLLRNYWYVSAVGEEEYIVRFDSEDAPTHWYQFEEKK